MTRGFQRVLSVFLIAMGALLAVDAVASDDDAWLTDFEKAKVQAAKKEVPILMDFTGSDWCIWCIRLDKEVLTQEEFKKFAKENLVLFKADFPMRKEQEPEVKQRNQELKRKYGVRGYPTIILVDAEGKEIARTGYQKGGAEAYVEHLKELMPEKEG